MDNSDEEGCGKSTMLTFDCFQRRLQLFLFCYLLSYFVSKIVLYIKLKQKSYFKRRIPRDRRSQEFQ